MNKIATEFSMETATKIFSYLKFHLVMEAALYRCSQEKVFWKYAAYLQENNNVEMWSQ